MESQASSKSNFVTVLAWVFIVLSGFATLISVAQNIMVQTMFNDPAFNGTLAASKQSPGVPAAASFMATHFKLFFASFFVLSTATLISSVGLLKRRNWARLIFISIMGLGIVWNLGGLLLQFIMFSSFPSPPATFHEPDAFKSMFITIMVFGAAMAVAFSLLFGWIIKRLVSQPIAAEFGR
jgi:hypothetical protein